MDIQHSNQILFGGLREQELKFLRNSLPAGSIHNIAKNLGLSVQTVTAILDGTKRDKRGTEVIKAALEEVKPFWSAKHRFLTGKP